MAGRTYAWHRPHTLHLMPAVHLPPRRTLACRSLLFLLWLGLLLHGQADVQRRLLGAAHWHVSAPHAVPASPAPAWTGWLAELRSWRQQRIAASPLVAGHAAVHHHDGSERHHHGPQDATVVTLEPLQDADATPSDTSAGSLLQPLALAGRLGWWPPAVPARSWPAPATPGWSDATLRQPERPPSA